MLRRIIFTLVLITLILVGAAPVGRGAHSASLGSPRQGRTWETVHNWVYWLDGPDLEQIGSSNSSFPPHGMLERSEGGWNEQQADHHRDRNPRV